MTTENGKPYTEFDNDIFEVLLLIPITKRKLKIMLTTLRLTDGFHEEEKKIPLSTFEFRTRIEKSNAGKALKECIDDNMIIRNENMISIQRDISKWEGVVKLTTLNKLSKQQLKLVGLATKKVVSLDTYKENTKSTFKEKVLSTKEIEKKRKADKTGLAMLKKAVRGSPDRKRKNL